MLVFHGDADKRVPLSQAVGWWRACEAYGIQKKVEMVVYGGESHNIARKANALDLQARILTFLDKVLAQ
jgi:dipeptidyl aminopeptidase/acylaminoacyl peptidase